MTQSVPIGLRIFRVMLTLVESAEDAMSGDRSFTYSGGALHPWAPRIAEAFRAGRIDRREFLSSVTGLGVTAATAFAMGGLTAPATAQEAPVKGGRLRIAMLIRTWKDPRTFDWSELANVSRQCNEHLVRWRRDFTFEGRLLQSWEISEDARVYVLRCREGVRWSNGDLFGADDLIHNITRWCEAAVPGNSMASRMGGLVDPETATLRRGALQRIDDLTVRLTLPAADISLIAGMADYPAIVMHPGYDGGADPIAAHAVGTGPYVLTAYETGRRAEVRRREGYEWWAGSPPLDAIEWIDLGSSPADLISAFAQGRIDGDHETAASSLASMKAIGMVSTSIPTASTIVARMKVSRPPFDLPEVRRAIQAAVDNHMVMEIGIEGRGSAAENHHVGPMHPEYAALPAQVRNVTESQALIRQTNYANHVFELVSVDDDWRRLTTDAIAAQMLDAGLRVRRTIVPDKVFRQKWQDFDFSTTNWSPRPLGVQVLALAYRTGAAWNETDFADPEFDELLDEALATPDVDARREIMADLERILQSSGVIVQPYWRKLYRSARPGVRNYDQHQSFEQHLEEVWIDQDQDRDAVRSTTGSSAR